MTNATGDVALADQPRDTTRTDLADILAAANQAHRDRVITNPQTRIVMLRALAEALDACVTELVDVADAETGLGVARLTGEVARTSAQLRLFADVIADGAYLEACFDSADPHAAPAPRPDLRRMLVALGPVLVFAASNFPFAFSILGGDTASALAAGCPVVVKAHPGHPRLSARCATLVQRTLARLGLPDGVLGVVYGAQAGLDAITDVRVKAAGFTGSTTAGRILFDAACARVDPIPFYGELGSTNPTVITAAAIAVRGTAIVSGLVNSVTLGNGQFCTKPGLIFLPTGHGLDAALAKAWHAVPPARMLTEPITGSFESGTTALKRHPGVRVVAVTASAPSEAASSRPVVGHLFATSVAEFSRDRTALDAECFGPAALLVEYGDIAELLMVVESLDGSLTATVHAEPHEASEVAPVVDALAQIAGRLIFNGWPTGVAVSWSMQHGGPWPSATTSMYTSVGASAVRRWLRPITFQSFPQDLLPDALQDRHAVLTPRRVDGILKLPEPT
jgi:NADP-dependent aldehyde dehydrogenase